MVQRKYRLTCALAPWPMILVGSGLLAQWQGPVNLDLGKVAATVNPGEPVDLPITWVGPEGAEVSKISFRVAFPGEQISFVNLQKGSASQAAQAELSWQREGSQEGEEILQLDIAAGQAIPEGVLCTLTFEIQEKVELGSNIPVRNLGLAAETLAGKQLEVRGEDGFVLFLGPIVACFFYMH